jgi:hypothetical protein
MSRPSLWLRACRRLLPSLCVLLLTGCPYSSDFPLSDPGAAPRVPALLGSWSLRDPETGETVTLVLRQNGPHEMVATSRDPDGKTDTYRLFVTRLGTADFLNVLDTGSGSSWFFIRYRLDGDALSLRVVDEALFKDVSLSGQDELREFMGDHADDPLLYGEPGDAQEMLWRRGLTP